MTVCWWHISNVNWNSFVSIYAMLHERVYDESTTHNKLFRFFLSFNFRTCRKFHDLNLIFVHKEKSIFDIWLKAFSLAHLTSCFQGPKLFVHKSKSQNIYFFSFSQLFFHCVFSTQLLNVLFGYPDLYNMVEF